MAGEGDTVGEDAVRAEVDIVRDVGVGHEEIFIADGGDHATAGGAAMDCDKLANFVAGADVGFGAFAVIFEVLGGDADGRVGVEDILFADGGGAFDVDVGF